MSECDRTAVRIQLSVNIDTQFLAYCHGLCCECLISLNNIEVFNLIACLSHNLLRCRNRTDTHNLRSASCKSAAYESCHRLNTQFFCLLLAHHYDGCRTVIDTGSISCGNESIRVDRTKLRKSLNRGTMSRSLVYLKLNHFLLLLNHNRHDLFLKSAALLCRFSLQLALQCELVKLFTRQAPLFTNIVRCPDHMIIIKSIPQCIFNHGIYQCAVIHSVTVTSLRDSIRSHGHVLHTAGNHDIRIACLNHLRRHIHTIQSGTAYNVNGNCRNFVRNTRFNGRLTCNVLTLSRLDYTTHIHVFDLIRRYTRSVQCFFDYDCAEFCYRSCA